MLNAADLRYPREAETPKQKKNPLQSAHPVSFLIETRQQALKQAFLPLRMCLQCQTLCFCPHLCLGFSVLHVIGSFISSHPRALLHKCPLVTLFSFRQIYMGSIYKFSINIY